LFFNPFSQIRKADTPIKKYSKVHTGPKIQFGGEKKGLFKNLYQVDIEDMVKGVPDKPTNSHPATAIKNLSILFTNPV
jgi:hypothetical protein